MSNFQQAPYLREQRKFPEDPKQLSEQIDNAYIDIAAKVNTRTIGIFSDDFFIVTGETWYLQGQPKRQQTLRKVFQISQTNLIFEHGIDFNTLTDFTRIYGTFYDGTNYYPLPYVNEVNANRQVSIVISPTQVIVTEGAGASPTIQSGLVILEWLSQF